MGTMKNTTVDNKTQIVAQAVVCYWTAHYWHTRVYLSQSKMHGCNCSRQRPVAVAKYKSVYLAVRV